MFKKICLMGALLVGSSLNMSAVDWPVLLDTTGTSAAVTWRQGASVASKAKGGWVNIYCANACAVTISNGGTLSSNEITPTALNGGSPTRRIRVFAPSTAASLTTIAQPVTASSGDLPPIQLDARVLSTPGDQLTVTVTMGSSGRIVISGYISEEL